AWQPPQVGVVKWNNDAVIFDTEQNIGMGAFLRDEAGRLITAIITNTDAVMTATGLYQGIKWIKSFGYRGV
ncbi:hypothetical protein A2U01_0094149, partial [Trifolium medium]|nr:hypothetical protein [Trifolium medium]